MKKLHTSLAVSAIALMGAFSTMAQAAEFPYNGQVQSVTGALAALITPIPQEILGSITFDDTAIASGSAGPADVVGLQVNIGAVCIASDIAVCAPGSFATPITSVDAATVTFTGGQPTGGSMTVTGSLTTPIILTVSVIFDLSAGTWTADALAAGTVGGSFVPTAPSVLGPFDANKVPSMPIYGLIIIGLGLLLVAGRRLRKTPTRR